MRPSKVLLDALLLILGLLWLGVGALVGMLFLLTALVGSSDWRFSSGMMVPIFAGLVGGGVVTLSALRSMFGSQPLPFRLPPAWALAGGFVLVLATGLGLWQAGVSSVFFVPLSLALAATLAPLAVVAWIVGRRPGGITARRGWVAFGLGATVSTSMAYLLNTFLSLAVLFLVSGLADEILPLAENLLDALAFGSLSQELASPWFLILLVQVAVIAPLVEELVKPLPLLPLLGRLATARDAMLMGMLVGAGFAAVENILYATLFGSAWSGVLAVRALGAALHPFGAGLMAVAWWRVLRQEPGAATGWVQNYGLAAGVHVLWNATCVVAAAVAQALAAGWEVQLLGVTDAALLLALLALEGAGLLVALRVVARHAEVASEESGVAGPITGLASDRAIAVWGLVCLVVLLPVGLGALTALL
jgi:RsiW-degrading membrane proteinase PrsW (M82 family)